MSLSNELIQFIKKSPSPFHAVKNAVALLRENGFTELKECESGNIARGGKYYITRNLSSVIAFKIPSGNINGFMITASHSDAPCFKIKHNCESEVAGYTRANVEKYGGMLAATWLDRPLSAAGKVTVFSGGRLTSKIIDLEKELFMIPSVAIHMNRSANENASYNANTDLQPISGSSESKGALKSLIAEKAGASEGDIVAYDLFLYPVTEGKVWGVNDEFLSAPRLDDLQCSFSALKALIASDESESISLMYIADNEEVGSSTKQGADSTFLSDTVERICRSLGVDRAQAVASSFMVSADNGHALHPNHPEYTDASHKPVMNGGVVIKHNAAQKYTTDSVSSTLFTAICQKADVPVQHYANRPDMAGGSTLGNISNTHLSLNTVDIGMAQLAMHSCYETVGAKDTKYLVKALTEFFSSSVKMTADGEYELK